MRKFNKPWSDGNVGLDAKIGRMSAKVDIEKVLPDSGVLSTTNERVCMGQGTQFLGRGRGCTSR